MKTEKKEYEKPVIIVQNVMTEQGIATTSIRFDTGSDAVQEEQWEEKPEQDYEVFI